MSMKPTCNLRIVLRPRNISPWLPREIHKQLANEKILQQLWRDEWSGLVEEWRDVEVVSE